MKAKSKRQPERVADEFVSVPLCIPDALAVRLRQIVARRTLGDTLDAVVNHMVRQYCFEVEEFVQQVNAKVDESATYLQQAKDGKAKRRPFPKAPAKTTARKKSARK